MKQFLVFLAILVQSLGSFSAEGKPAVASGKSFQKLHAVASSDTADDSEADLNTGKISGTSFKIRVSRSFASSTAFQHEHVQMPVTVINTTISYRSPFYLPLVRLLLYPKHYFW